MLAFKMGSSSPRKLSSNADKLEAVSGIRLALGRQVNVQVVILKRWGRKLKAPPVVALSRVR